MEDPLSKKQLEFVINSTAQINLAHGAVRTGKTVGCMWRFMQYVATCPDSDLWMIGHTSETIYHNAVRMVMESPQFDVFRPYCTWFPGKRQLKFLDKTISTLGAKDEGAIGGIQGKTFSGCYCDEMQLYPDSIIDMISTRLSRPHSKLFASMNPSHPDHKLKKWIDKAIEGDPNYYQLHFVLDDNPFVDEDYKNRIKNSLSGVFYKRNYLGLWCLAEGAIFDFFDKDIHIVKRPPRAAEYYVAGLDFGMSNPTACVLIGVSTGKYTEKGRKMWIEKEYYYDPGTKSGTGRQKTLAEIGREIESFLEPYGVRSIYIDPSALALKVELQRKGLPIVQANNDVEEGIQIMTSMMADGDLSVCIDCKNLIREIEGYVWDHKKALLGIDAPIKKDDHAIDSLRYVCATHKVPKNRGDDENFGRTLGFRR